MSGVRVPHECVFMSEKMHRNDFLLSTVRICIVIVTLLSNTLSLADTNSIAVEKTGANEFKVSNSDKTSDEKSAIDMTLLASAMLAKKEGLHHFVIVANGSTTSNQGAVSLSPGEPARVNQIFLLNAESTEGSTFPGLFRVQEVIDVIRAKYGLPDSIELNRKNEKCMIVYGPEWAFGINVPNHWQSACHAEKTHGVPLALWPEGFSWANAMSRMYITVSLKHGMTLKEFADDEIERFKVESPNVKAESLAGIQDSASKIERHLSGDRNGSHELIEYLDGGAVFYILVFSSKTQEDFDKLNRDFEIFASSFQQLDRSKFGIK